MCKTSHTLPFPDGDVIPFNNPSGRQSKQELLGCKVQVFVNNVPTVLSMVLLLSAPSVFLSWAPCSTTDRQAQVLDRDLICCFEDGSYRASPEEVILRPCTIDALPASSRAPRRAHPPSPRRRQAPRMRRGGARPRWLGERSGSECGARG